MENFLIMIKKKALIVLIAIPILYFLTGLYLCYNIDRIAFVPTTMDKDEVLEFDFPSTERFIKLNEKDSVNILYSKTSLESKGLVLFFHGNSSDLRSWGKMSPQFHKNGYDVVMVDYPGFGKSSGKQSEQGLYDSADKLYKWASKKYDKKDMVIVGRSIGSIPASYLSSKVKVKRTILETPLSNMGKLIRKKFKFAPICNSLYDRFAVDSWLEKSKNEVHIIRSENDKLIIEESTDSLLNMVDSHFMIEGAEHGNLGSFDSYQKRISELLLN